MWSPGDLEYVRLPAFNKIEEHFSRRVGRDELAYRYDLAIKTLDDGDIMDLVGMFGFDAADVACFAGGDWLAANRRGAVTMAEQMRYAGLSVLRAARDARLPLVLLMVVRDGISWFDIAHAVLPDVVVATITIARP